MLIHFIFHALILFCILLYFLSANKLFRFVSNQWQTEWNIQKKRRKQTIGKCLYACFYTLCMHVKEPYKCGIAPKHHHHHQVAEDLSDQLFKAVRKWNCEGNQKWDRKWAKRNKLKLCEQWTMRSIACWLQPFERARERLSVCVCLCVHGGCMVCHGDISLARKGKEAFVRSFHDYYFGP